MQRTRLLLTTLVALVAFSTSLHAQRKSIPLRIEGDTVIVVKTLPCKIVAPPGYDLYVWTFPDSVQASDEEATLTITKAPKGVFRVRVSSVRINFETKKVEKDRGEIDVVVGDEPSPPPPPPPVPPVDEFVKALQDAYGLETAGDKHETVLALALVYRAAARLLRSGKVTTAGQLWAAMLAGAKEAKLEGKLKRVQQVVYDNELKNLPSRSSDKIDSGMYEQYAKVFDKCANALEKVKR